MELKRRGFTDLTMQEWTFAHDNGKCPQMSKAHLYVSGLVLGLISMVITVLGVAVLITYSPQNGIILLVIAFLLSPFGLPQLAFWLLGKMQDLKFVIQDLVYG